MRRTAACAPHPAAAARALPPARDRRTRRVSLVVSGGSAPCFQGGGATLRTFALRSTTPIPVNYKLRSQSWGGAAGHPLRSSAPPPLLYIYRV